MTSNAKTVNEYLAGLPLERKTALAAVREVILGNLPRGYAECMQYGMISYVVPHSLYPAGYHCDPKQALTMAMLGSQKNHMAVYMMCIYNDDQHAEWFVREWARTGKKLDKGKSCIRFKDVDDLALDVIGEAIRRVPAQLYIQRYETGLQATRPKVAAKRAAAAAKAPASKPSAKATKPAASKKTAAKKR